MSDEKKTRQRLTMTAMYEAIVDIDKLTSDVPYYNRALIMVREERDGATYYRVGLERVDIGASNTSVMQAESQIDFEDAVAHLLTKMKDKFEEHRKKLLGGLDSVLERHHGALRGARSKIREKKA